MATGPGSRSLLLFPSAFGPLISKGSCEGLYDGRLCDDRRGNASYGRDHTGLPLRARCIGLSSAGLAWLDTAKQFEPITMQNSQGLHITRRRRFQPDNALRPARKDGGRASEHGCYFECHVDEAVRQL